MIGTKAVSDTRVRRVLYASLKILAALTLDALAQRAFNHWNDSSPEVFTAVYAGLTIVAAVCFADGWWRPSPGCTDARWLMVLVPGVRVVREYVLVKVGWFQVDAPTDNVPPICAIFIGPIFEEIVWRGLLLRGLWSLTGSWAVAVVVSSAAFSMGHYWHPSIEQWENFLRFGLLAWGVRRWGLATTITCHMSMNLFVELRHQMLPVGS